MSSLLHCTVLQSALLHPIKTSHLTSCCGQAPHEPLFLFQDWLVNTWDCLLGLSRVAVEQKLADTTAGIMAELRKRTGQTLVNVFLDEAQVGTHKLDGYFPNRDNSLGRPLLNAWVRSLHQRVFAPFHFNLTGTLSRTTSSR
jgi:hypothetical protein